MNFTIFLFSRKNEKTPETLDFTGFSGGVFGVPEVIRTPDLPLRSRPGEVFFWSLSVTPKASQSLINQGLAAVVVLFQSLSVTSDFS